jgi:hypothetical protein
MIRKNSLYFGLLMRWVEEVPETMKRVCQDMVVTCGMEGGEELRPLSWEASRDAALPSA